MKNVKNRNSVKRSLGSVWAEPGEFHIQEGI